MTKLIFFEVTDAAENQNLVSTPVALELCRKRNEGPISAQKGPPKIFHLEIELPGEINVFEVKAKGVWGNYKGIIRNFWLDTIKKEDRDDSILGLVNYWHEEVGKVDLLSDMNLGYLTPRYLWLCFYFNSIWTVTFIFWTLHIKGRVAWRLDCLAFLC